MSFATSDTSDRRTARLLAPEDLARLRHRGAAGGTIVKHRALGRIEVTRAEVARAAIGTVVMTAAWIVVMPVVTRAWLAGLRWAHDALELPGAVRARPVNFPLLREAVLPAVDAPMRLPGTTSLVVSALVSLAVIVLPTVVRSIDVPGRYGLRVLASIQLVATAYFALWPGAFPYTMRGYTEALLTGALLLIALVPVLFGTFFYVFDVAWWRKIGLTVATMMHLAVVMPALVLLHVVVALALSAVALPLMYIVAGIPVGVLVVVAFYGVGMSWPPGARAIAAQAAGARRPLPHTEASEGQAPGAPTVTSACRVCGDTVPACRCSRAAFAAAARGDRVRARMLLAHLAMQSPAVTRLWKTSGLLALVDGDLRAAALAWRIAAAQDDDVARAWLVSLRRGMIASAVRMCRDAAALADAGELSEAIREVRQALARVPDLGPAARMLEALRRREAHEITQEELMFSIRDELDRLAPISLGADGVDEDGGLDVLLEKWRATAFASDGSSLPAATPAPAVHPHATGVVAVLDDLEDVFRLVPEDARVHPVLRRAAARIRQTAVALGLTEIAATGGSVRDDEHVVVGAVPADDVHPPGTVAQLVSWGFRAGDEVVRRARVVAAVSAVHAPLAEPARDPAT